MVASVRTARDKVVRNGAIRRQVTVSVKSVAYNGGRSIAAAPNELTIDWTVGSDGSLERVEQDFSVKRSTGREHLTGKWKRRDGVTRIKGTVLPRKIVLNGLVLIRLMIREGSLVVEW